MEWWMIVSAVIAVVVVNSYKNHTRDRRKLAELLTKLAERHGGEAKQVSFFTLPELRFEGEHGHYLVTAMPNAGAQAYSQGPFALVDLELGFDTGQSLSANRSDQSVEQHAAMLVDTAIGRAQLTTAETDFVNTFRTLAGDFVFARRLLDEHTREVLLASKLPQLDIRVEGKKITVFSDGYPGSEAVLQEMVDIATLLAKRCAELRHTG